LEDGFLAAARDRIIQLIQQPEAGSAQGRMVLLTEQLIKYAKDDSFFNLHWDIDAQSEDEPLPSGTELLESNPNPNPNPNPKQH
jgi:hypothetical protein